MYLGRHKVEKYHYDSGQTGVSQLRLDNTRQSRSGCTDGVANFGMVDQVIREQSESKKDMPLLSVEAILTKLHNTFAVLTELTCSENVWKRTLTRFARLLRKPNRYICSGIAHFSLHDV